MLTLTVLYAGFEATSAVRGGLYGLGPVVLAIFVVAVYRLGRSTVRKLDHAIIGLVAAAAMAFTPFGIAMILGLAAAVGIARFHSLRLGIVVLAVLTALITAIQLVDWSLMPAIARLTDSNRATSSTSLVDIASSSSRSGRSRSVAA
jgi:chromate transport protein ChrA